MIRNRLVLVGILALAIPSVAQAQVWDASAYEVSARECVANLNFAQQAMTSGDSDRAWTYLELADTPCQTSRAILASAIATGALSGSEREVRVGDYVAQEAAWITLGVDMGMCAEARLWLEEMAAIVPEIPDSVSDRYIAASQAVLRCVQTSGPTCTPSGGSFTVGQGWADQSGYGMAGGQLDGSTVSYDIWGFYPNAPHFAVEVTSPGEYIFGATSTEGDLTMMVRGPGCEGAVYFSDDFEGLNPAVVAALAPGTYYVWVGEYQPTGAGSAFTAVFGAAQVTPLNVVTMRATGNAISETGLAGGGLSASMFGSDCNGWVSSQPQFQLNVTEYARVSVEVTSTADLTLVITGPYGTWCNDDFTGLNPAISDYLSAGTYDVYVGEYTETLTGSSFSARFSNDELVWVDPYAPQSQCGIAYVGAGYGISSLNCDSGGPRNARDVFGSDCNGYIGDLPTFQMELTGNANVSVTITATDDGDTTLVVTGPGGTYCDDDTNGYNPVVTQHMAPGIYEVYVGSYDQGEVHPVTANFSAY